MDIEEAQKHIPDLCKEFYDFYPQFKLQPNKLSVEAVKTEEFYPRIREWESINCINKAPESLIENFKEKNTDGMMLMGKNKKIHIVIDAEKARNYSHLSQIVFHELAHSYFMANDKINKNQMFDNQQQRGYYFWHEFVAQYFALTLIFRKNKSMTFNDVKYVADESLKVFIEHCNALSGNADGYLVNYYVARFHMDELKRKYTNQIDRRKFAGKDLDKYLEPLFRVLNEQIFSKDNIAKINKRFIDTIGEHVFQTTLYGEDYRYGPES